MQQVELQKNLQELITMMRYKDTNFIATFDYRGEVMRSVRFVNGANVVITYEQSINPKILVVNIYLDGKRVRGLRYEKENFGLFLTNDIINSIYWDFIFDGE